MHSESELWKGPQFFKPKTLYKEAVFSYATLIGWLRDYTVVENMFQDMAGTIPVTAPGQPVALIRGAIIYSDGTRGDLVQPIEEHRPTAVRAEDGVWGIRSNGCLFPLDKASADVMVKL